MVDKRKRLIGLLIFYNPERLKRLLNDPWHPIQIVFPSAPIEQAREGKGMSIRRR
jgi:hypothetical protein